MNLKIGNEIIWYENSNSEYIYQIVSAKIPYIYLQRAYKHENNNIGTAKLDVDTSFSASPVAKTRNHRLIKPPFELFTATNR